MDLPATHAVGEDAVLGDRLAEIGLEGADPLLDQPEDLLDVPFAAGLAGEVDDAAAVRGAAGDGRNVEVDAAVLLLDERVVLGRLGEDLALLGNPWLEPERDPDAGLSQLRQVGGRVREAVKSQTRSANIPSRSHGGSRWMTSVGTFSSRALLTIAQTSCQLL